MMDVKDINSYAPRAKTKEFESKAYKVFEMFRKDWVVVTQLVLPTSSILALLHGVASVLFGQYLVRRQAQQLLSIFIRHATLIRS